jgi:DNA-binding response OmpR family regulator
MGYRVLIIDDDKGLLDLLCMQLEREGFSPIPASSGAEGVRQAAQDHPDVIILDLMMPEMDGWHTYEALRTVWDAPIIVLTARTNIKDRIKGLALGTDDYLTKPYDLAVLKERIHRLLDRERPGAQEEWWAVFDDGELRIDLGHKTIERQGRELDLSPTEARLLMYLARRKGKIVSCTQILVDIWGQDYADQIAYLHTYMEHLRRKVERDPSHPQYIRTDRKLGYYFTDAPAALSG